MRYYIGAITTVYRNGRTDWSGGRLALVADPIARFAIAGSALIPPVQTW